MKLGKFQHDGDGFSGPLNSLGLRQTRVRFEHRDKGANYVIFGDNDTELGAAWLKTGEFGDYLSVRLDCPTLPAPINATMKLTPTDDGFYVLRWQRRDPARGNDRGKHGGGDDDTP